MLGAAKIFPVCVNSVGSARWGVAGNSVVAWILTIPASGLIARLAYSVSRALF